MTQSRNACLFFLLIGLTVVSMTTPSVLRAQQPDSATPVMTKVYVTMLETGSYGHPMPNVSIIAVGSNDRVALRTDAAGVATSQLPAGSYRFVVADPVVWQGRAFTWDVPVNVRTGMGIVELSQSNATASASGQAGAVPPSPSPKFLVLDRKDPAVATLLSFFIPGVGQMYAGSPGKGVAMLMVHVVGAGAMVAGATKSVNDCSYDYYGDCSSSDGNTLMYVGAGVVLGNWIVSMIDAHGTANAYNVRHGVVAQLRAARPMFAMGSANTVRTGLSIPVSP